MRKYKNSVKKITFAVRANAAQVSNTLRKQRLHVYLSNYSLHKYVLWYLAHIIDGKVDRKSTKLLLLDEVMRPSLKKCVIHQVRIVARLGAPLSLLLVSGNISFTIIFAIDMCMGCACMFYGAKRQCAGLVT